jgi:hypothetical protein
MRLVYSSSSLNRKITEEGDGRNRVEDDPTSIEDLMMQIKYLSDRVKQLEVNHAWSEKILN